MPVQINEVIIKAVVDSQPSGGADNRAENPTDSNCCGACEVAEKVLEIIKEKQQR